MVWDLAQDLDSTKSKVTRGCQVLVPETVFLKDGKFEQIIQNDKDYCLVIDNKTSMINLKIRMKL
jgi:hypothetical protein